jgi:hypothetical protein
MGEKQGHGHAEACIGLMYFEGWGLAQDRRKALRWWLRAADRGIDWARACIGEMYWSGRGVAQDDEEALRWFRKAAAHNAFLAGTLAEKLTVLESASPARQGDGEISQAIRESIIFPGDNERLQAALGRLDAMTMMAGVAERQINAGVPKATRPQRDLAVNPILSTRHPMTPCFAQHGG